MMITNSTCMRSLSSSNRRSVACMASVFITAAALVSIFPFTPHKGLKKGPKNPARTSDGDYDDHKFDDRSLYRTTGIIMSCMRSLSSSNRRSVACMASVFITAAALVSIQEPCSHFGWRL
jgi:hypothetical protein